MATANQRVDPWAAWWHPLPLAALAVTALNDHVAKAAWPSALTGKVSDVAGLFFFPLFASTLIVVLAPPARAPRRARATLAAVCAAAGLVFTALKTAPSLTNWFAAHVGELLFAAPLQITVDPTDLWTLPAVAAAWLFGARRWR